MAKKMQPEEFFEHENVEEYCVKPVFDQDGVQVSSSIGSDGLEYPDPTPLAPPIGYNQPPDLMQMIRTMIRNERYQQAFDEMGFETFEESDDFDIDDDPLDPQTDYERVFEPADEAKTPKPVAAPQPPAAPAVGSAAAGGGSPKDAPPAPPVPQTAAQSPST